MPRPDPAITRYGAAVLLRQLNALTDEVEGVRESKDPEYLHRMRVASRRLRASLPLFAAAIAPKQADAWQREIRKLTRALGPARDADVQIETIRAYLSSQPPENRPGLRRLVLRLSQVREGLQKGVLQSLDNFEQGGVAQRMRDRLAAIAEVDESTKDTGPEALFVLSWQVNREKLSALLTFEPYVRRPECIEELHAMRIAAKQLRYSLEIFAPIYPGSLKKEISQVKEAQTLLGDLHDCDVWLQFLPEFILEENNRMQAYLGHTRPFRRMLPGLQAFEEDRRRMRESIYRKFVRQWEAWQHQNTWLLLAQTLQSFCPAPEIPLMNRESDANNRADR